METEGQWLTIHLWESTMQQLTPACRKNLRKQRRKAETASGRPAWPAAGREHQAGGELCASFRTVVWEVWRVSAVESWINRPTTCPVPSPSERKRRGIRMRVCPSPATPLTKWGSLCTHFQRFSLRVPSRGSYGSPSFSLQVNYFAFLFLMLP